MNDKVAVVIIGRNEGERLKRCLQSVRLIEPRVYVDSGSSDGSVHTARAAGCHVVTLAEPPSFTAARARNAGITRVLQIDPSIEFIQMIDGDCELQPGWLDAARAILDKDHGVGLVFGRRRERFPHRSVYNALCDDEWNSPVGESPGCGGDALFRVTALSACGYYNAAMIAGEDSELSYRMRKEGWRLLRIATEMTIHDADILTFRQWWKRIKRSGHGYAEMARLHPDATWPNWPRSVKSILVWGAGAPAVLVSAIALAMSVNKAAWLIVAAIVAVWTLRVVQLTLRQHRNGLTLKIAIASGVLLMVGKLPQFLGVVNYQNNRLRGRSSRLIEYKAHDLS